jgi:hypothetical protein
MLRCLHAIIIIIIIIFFFIIIIFFFGPSIAVFISVIVNSPKISHFRIKTEKIHK